VSSNATERQTYLVAMAKILKLPIAEDFEPGVLANLEVTAEHAAVLDEFLPDDHLDPAPVFRP
jgi:hypothetical protein